MDFSTLYNEFMQPGRLIRLVVSLICLSLTCSLLGWGLWPNTNESRTVLVPSESLDFSSEYPPCDPSMEGAFSLILSWPRVIRAGDAGFIDLSLEASGSGQSTQPTITSKQTSIDKRAIPPNLNQSCNVIAEARLDMGGMQVLPPGMSDQTFQKNQRIAFRWSIHPEEEGAFQGIVWFYLRAIPPDGSPEIERAIAALQIEGDVVSFLGLEGGTARIVGVVGLFICIFLGIPFLKTGPNWILNRFLRGK